MWANLRTFTLVLAADTVDAMAKGMLALVASASLFVVVGLLRSHVWPRQRVVWALLLVLVAGGSIAAPIALRGRATIPGARNAPHRHAARARGDGTALARHDPRDRRRVAGPHHGRGRGRPVAEFRARARRRRRHAPGDASPDVGRSRVDRRRHGKAAAEKRRPIRRHLSPGTGRRPRAAAARLLLRVQAGALRTRRRRAAHLGRASHAPVLEHPERPRHSRRRRRMAADAAGARRARLRGERRLSAPRRDTLGHRRRVVGVSARHQSGRRRRG